EADAVCADAIRAPSFTALVLGIAAWTETGGDNEALVGDKSLRRKLSKTAPALLDRLSRKVQKRGRAVALDAPPGALHPLRKSAKKLRYGVEFVTSLYPRKDVKRFVKPLKALQKSLGVINDAAMATRRGEELARGGRFELDVPVGVLASSRVKTSRA